MIMEQSVCVKQVATYSDEAGKNLTYTSVYDDIRNARYEEDERLSQGVWVRDTARADWEKVQHLCVKALKTQSKDLQIVGWLVEAFTMLEGFKGIATGIGVLKEFINTWWEKCYPRTTDDKSDDEQKIRILDWIYEMVHKRVVLLPIINFSLYDYEYANNLETTIQQNPLQTNSLLENAKKNGIKTINEINDIVSSANSDICNNILKQLTNISHSINSFTLLIKNKLNLNTPFTKLSDDISKIRQLFKSKMTENNVSNENNNITELHPVNQLKTSNRDSLYSAIDEVTKQLEQVDKHSPAPYLLKLVVSWKDKNLLEIMNDLRQGETEAHLLLRRLLG